MKSIILFTFVIFTQISVIAQENTALANIERIEASKFSDQSLAEQIDVPESAAELNPFSPDVEEVLNKFDAIYKEETGEEPILVDSNKASCYQSSCPVWIRVSKYSQRLALYINGEFTSEWAVSSGGSGHETPDFDRHPNGRMYTQYTSTKYPEGDFQGLGNMPYAIFISGGFALHGTPASNWRNLGRRASHGCIRMHPTNARYLFGLVRQTGIRNTWITVE